MMVMDEKRLVEKVLGADLLPVRVQEVKTGQNIVMVSEPEDKFMEFVKRTGTRYLFYFYTYYDIAEYLIPYDWYSDYSKAFQAVVQEHNQALREFDFSVPQKLTLSVLLDGTYVGAEYEDAWLAVLGIDEAEREFEKIEARFYPDSI